jgi:hypothetical protein
MQSMEIPDATPLHIETLDGGSPMGGASVGLIIELANGCCYWMPGK